MFTFIAKFPNLYKISLLDCFVWVGTFHSCQVVGPLGLEIEQIVDAASLLVAGLVRDPTEVQLHPVVSSVLAVPGGGDVGVQQPGHHLVTVHRLLQQLPGSKNIITIHRKYLLT